MASKPQGPKAWKLTHAIFEVGIVLKGINAVVELIVGTFLVLTTADQLKEIIDQAVAPLLDHQRLAWIADISLRFAERVSDSGKDFAGWYFLSHGIVKLAVVICLLKGWLWAYPLGIAMFAVFMVFQTVEFFTGKHNWFYLFLDVFDGFMIWLTVKEWQHAKSLRTEAKAA